MSKSNVVSAMCFFCHNDVVTTVNSINYCVDCEAQHAETVKQYSAQLEELEGVLRQLNNAIQDGIATVQQLVVLKKQQTSLRQAVYDFLFGSVEKEETEEEMLSIAVEEFYAGNIQRHQCFEAMN